YFTELGYAEDVSSFLASLCTYSISKKKKEKVELNERFLPQGAPTSPYLSNLILMKFDDTIANYCKEKSIKYTRYADDMAFSGSDFDKEILIKLVQSELNKVDLKLNKSKINFMKQNVPQVISGVLVNKKIQLPKEIRNEIRNTMYFITKYGYEDHIKRTNETRDYYLLHLLGRIQYALNLNPNDSELIKYKSVLLEYKKKYYN
ncbi:reverse transcriptase domain-containing protein, partial [Elizabethkingia miricola]